MTKYDAALANWEFTFNMGLWSTARRWWAVAEALRSGGIWSGGQER